MSRQLIYWKWSMHAFQRLQKRKHQANQHMILLQMALVAYLIKRSDRYQIRIIWKRTIRRIRQKVQNSNVLPVPLEILTI